MTGPLHLPILRWGKRYESLERRTLRHAATGEVLAEVSLANAALVQRDLRRAPQAREALCAIPCEELIARCAQAARLFMEAELEVGEGPMQSPEDHLRCQSGTTGLPEHLCRAGMHKLEHVLTHMGEILESLTRGLPLEVLTAGLGDEGGVLRSYQASAPALGLVLPSNSPGVHALWLPVLPLQVGLVLKPGAGDPWTPYRLAAAFTAAGFPAEAIAIYPGEADIGVTVARQTRRSLVFGAGPTVQAFEDLAHVQVHGPGFSKILIGADQVDDWEAHLDLMVDSILRNAGRSCLSCSSIWAPRHTEAIAEALAARLGPIEGKALDDPEALLAVDPGGEQAQAIDALLEDGLSDPGCEDVTRGHRDGPRLQRAPAGSVLRPTIVHCASPEAPLANVELMFPYASVVACPQERMLEAIGPTLVGTALTEDPAFTRQLLDATGIDRLNLGPIPTQQIDWRQPHEGNLVDFLFRARALQRAAPRA